ncbi:hypothetical protein C2869_21170 [Saccharobesus litoralis]|uniref:2OG-Fe dioxygenase family protein n=1 Tax=Saccharobesus litoralis TaxID=2172099 RepID=A0A2S0VX37_9ALTE|nr:2OG-Fe dioxygenase family protein [Saccharobesus litoralis]AWB68753.1 hypothetical protein C2869_21170 [Saccharobesus litoralis]
MSAVHHFNDENFFLELGQLDPENVAFLADSFQRLPSNPYKDGSFRVRRFSHFKCVNDDLTHLPHKKFTQSAVYNRFQGDVVRDYEEIEDEVVESEAFVEMFHYFKTMAHVKDHADIDVHQIRVLASANHNTPVAPEGVHQDGFDKIGIFVIRREHITGGEINVHLSRDTKPIMSYAFDHGEFIILNDKRFWHGAATISATDEQNAYMDVFVLTACD